MAAPAGEWVFLEPWPEMHAAIERWTMEAAFAETQRDVDGWIMLGFDHGRPVELDRVIEHIRPWPPAPWVE